MTIERREGTCRICGRRIFEFAIGTFQHLDWDDPDHNAEPDAETAQRDGPVCGQ